PCCPPRPRRRECPRRWPPSRPGRDDVTHHSSRSGAPSRGGTRTAGRLPVATLVQHGSASGPVKIDRANGHAEPRYPAYITATAVSEDELVAAADAAVQRSGGRGALGPIPKGATVLVLTNEDQDEGVMGHLADAMRGAGAASVTTRNWSELGLPTGS